MVYHGLMNNPRRRRAILIICDGLGRSRACWQTIFAPATIAPSFHR